MVLGEFACEKGWGRGGTKLRMSPILYAGAVPREISSSSGNPFKFKDGDNELSSSAEESSPERRVTVE